MANNFRLTGDYYVSKKGIDSNDGLTQETPKLTLQAGLNLITSSNKRLIVGAGVYKEAILRSLAFSYDVIADGEVTFEGSPLVNFSIYSTGTTIRFYNITFRDYSSFQTQLSGGVSGFTIEFYNCTFINTDFSLSVNAVNLYKSKLINSKIASGSLGVGSVNSYNSIFLNVSNRINFAMLSCYVDSASYISISSTTSAANFNYNNIQGKIIMNTNGAVSGANSNGVAQSFAQHRIDYPTYNVNSISANPLFNDVQNLNFTLQSSSPHIRAANDFISNIGGTEYAVYMKASDTELTSGATITNLTLQGNNSYVITSPSTTGSIITGAKLLQWPRTKPLTRIEWAGSLEFNKSITAGTAGNQNVPDYETSNTGAAASPDRLCVKMRFSTQQTQPATSGEWDNDGLWTAGQYRLFEINSKPKVDVNGLGNGSSAYVEFTGLGDIVPSWVQMDIVLINNYS